MILEMKVKMGKRSMLYIPKAICEAIGLKEGIIVKLKVDNGRLIIEPIPDPFDLALDFKKFAKTTFEEFEKESEEFQNELFK